MGKINFCCGVLGQTIEHTKYLSSVQWMAWFKLNWVPYRPKYTLSSPIHHVPGRGYSGYTWIIVATSYKVLVSLETSCLHGNKSTETESWHVLAKCLLDASTFKGAK